MTFGAASWLIYPFRFLLGRPSHRQSVHGPRRTSLRLDPLESRELLSSSADVWNFVTAPRLHPMKVSVQVQEPGTVAGLIFVGPYAVSQSSSDLVGQTGPLIMDNSGNPVWFLPVSSTNKKQVTDFRVQSYLGQPVLTWWQGTIAGTVPSDLPNGTALPGARFYIYNDHYQKIMTVKAAEWLHRGRARILNHPPRRRVVLGNQSREGKLDSLRRCQARCLCRL